MFSNVVIVKGSLQKALFLILIIIFNFYKKNRFFFNKRSLRKLQAFYIVKDKKHSTIACAEEGLKQIVALKASLNKGLSDELKLNFPNVTLAIISNYSTAIELEKSERSLSIERKILDPN